MKTLRYPIGIQTFSEIITGGYTYVDKTSFIQRLVAGSKYYFLSRPRRFGKSLFLSTLHAYFEGRRELFEGLALDRAEVEWSASPVLHFDLNSENYKVEDGLTVLLEKYLSDYEKLYNVKPYTSSVSTRFANLVQSIFTQTGKKVVILVDEYDKPLLDIEENEALFKANQAILKGFFGNLKTLDPYIRFAFLTGVARFNKVSIFSDLNNLNDISFSPAFADICGWTEKELIDNFGAGIEELAVVKGKTFESTLASLRDFYDGYLFTRFGNRIYNPFSVLLALDHQVIDDYWFETGTPSFLIKRVKNSGIDLSKLDHQYCHEDDLKSIGFDSSSPVALMFQTGYLTIEGYDEARRRYTLRFPNKEVELGFARSLYPIYVENSMKPDSPFRLFEFQDDLFDGNPESFMRRLQTLIKDMPYESQNETTYRSIVWLLCTLSGSLTESERHSYKGRSDLEVSTPNFVYIFEFKYNGSVEEAMAQLNDRDYAGRFAFDKRNIFLIGANFSDSSNKKSHHQSADRGLSDWMIEQYNK